MHGGYIYEYPNLSFGDAYWAELTRADDGVTITTCPIYPIPMVDTVDMKYVTDSYVIVSPTFINSSNHTLTVNTNICGEYYIYYVDGRFMEKQPFCPTDDEKYFKIDMTPYLNYSGVYLIMFKGDEGSQTVQKITIAP